MKIAFLVQGLFEISDSIGFDCVYQYRLLRDMPGGETARLFAERFDQARHPDVPIEDLPQFHAWCDENPDGIIIYHYCGAWPAIDDFLRGRPARAVIRWHNNTAPWFYLSQSTHLSHTLAGFENIVALAQAPHLRFWVNSDFTRDQFAALGGDPGRCTTVFPASRYLTAATNPDSTPQHRIFPQEGPINLVFVSRVVAHKGHRSIVAIARRVAALTGRPVIVRFAGREDDVKKDIAAFAAKLQVDVRFLGEISEAELSALYRQSDALLCLSEHEGFGLPVFEAMRCDLPVVAWRNTALDSLLAEHPLAFQHYDLNLFAAAVASLADPLVHSQVLDAQQHIREHYSPRVVRDQITQGLRRLAENDRETTMARLRALSEDTSALTPDIEKALGGWLLRAGETARGSQPPAIDAFETAVLHDSGSNLVSFHDLRMFRDLTEGREALHAAAFGAPATQGQLHFGAELFTGRDSRLVDGRLDFAAGPYPSGHRIFGPYLTLPKGYFEVVFDLVIDPAGNPFASDVVIDVFCMPGGVVGRHRLRAATIGPSTIFTLRFDLPAGDPTTEFRVAFSKPFSAALSFGGVTIRRAGPRPPERRSLLAGLGRTVDRLVKRGRKRRS
ncbi:glycosyltransferase family 4 protein [Gluconacetobacter sp. 1c LMG 22058]|uniref:Glycosyltransferase family 4 protein n=1 Tax=Gluconacetobacter dulcium TaxID=2729096 RepID=A0A7W4JXV0_9PROT|nr:glycosyltransferase family 4 protein [Gluconacetobacter dulcium]MBB2196737.1 glycosyltransferase family 4 protein [Gluconacetobacter dulcium]